MNIVFHVVEKLATNNFWLGACGAGLTVVPILGIMYVHRIKKSDGKSVH